jgi:hypothetical protein
MAKLSITAAWEETAVFVKREARLLFPIAFLLLSLPAAILQAMMPVTEPGRMPEPGLWLGFLPVLLVGSLIGTLAVSYLALRPGASVGEALQIGLRRFLPLLGAVLLIGCGAALIMVPLIMIVGVIAAAGGGTAVPPAFAVLLVLIMVPLYLFVWVRLILMTPAAAVERIGPIGLIRRSWELTAGHFWRLLGFFLLILIVSVVMLGAVAAVFGILIALIVGPPQPGNLAMFLISLVSALVQAVVSAVLTAFIARIYAQLAGPTVAAEVFA